MCPLIKTVFLNRLFQGCFRKLHVAECNTRVRKLEKHRYSVEGLDVVDFGLIKGFVDKKKNKE